MNYNYKYFYHYVFLSNKLCVPSPPVTMMLTHHFIIFSPFHQEQTTLLSQSKTSSSKHMTEEKHVSTKSDKWTYVAGTEMNPENRYGKPGASINAYAPTATPPYDFSFLSHAAYGLEMYPN